MENTVTLGGNTYIVAPLRSLQVAELYDGIDKSEGETKVATITRSLKAIARCLQNAKVGDFTSNLSEEAAIAKVDEISTFDEVNAAFKVVLEVSGLAKSEPGEPKAVEGSTSSASSAASSTD